MWALPAVVGAERGRRGLWGTVARAGLHTQPTACRERGAASSPLQELRRGEGERPKRKPAAPPRREEMAVQQPETAEEPEHRSGGL